MKPYLQKKIVKRPREHIWFDFADNGQLRAV